MNRPRPPNSMSYSQRLIWRERDRSQFTRKWELGTHFSKKKMLEMRHQCREALSTNPAPTSRPWRELDGTSPSAMYLVCGHGGAAANLLIVKRVNQSSAFSLPQPLSLPLPLPQPQPLPLPLPPPVPRPRYCNVHCRCRWHWWQCPRTFSVPGHLVLAPATVDPCPPPQGLTLIFIPAGGGDPAGGSNRSSAHIGVWTGTA